MSFNEKMAVLLQRIPSVIEHLETEEATKNALVMPFIAALGYDVFNPQEVVPEFVADVGLKKGEKVDYAIKKDGNVIILIECKKVQTNLCETEMSQLYRYFAVTRARLAILTNGLDYWFYSDLVEPNRMDERPFLKLDLRDPRKSDLAQVKQLAKEEFDLDRMLSVASELKYISEFQGVFNSQLENPDDDFVKFFFVRTVPGGRFTAANREMYAPLISRAFNQLVSDRVNDRIRSALQGETAESKKPDEPAKVQPAEESSCKDGVFTTEDEMEAFRIVRAILCRTVVVDRVFMRDNKSYCAILLDDNNRKPVCRFWFNGKTRYLGVFNEQREEEKVPIQALSDIYSFAERLIATAQKYESNQK